MAALAGAAVVLLAGCGGDQGSATSVARSYEQAILSRDGDALCAAFAPKFREVIEEQIASEDCGAFYHLLIGYPHENAEKQFVAGNSSASGAHATGEKASSTRRFRRS